MTLELTEKQAAIIQVLVDRRIDELGPEIHHTHSRAYRKELSKELEALEALRGLFAAGVVAAAQGGHA